jgi:hypothetical protein
MGHGPWISNTSGERFRIRFFVCCFLVRRVDFMFGLNRGDFRGPLYNVDTRLDDPLL